MGLDTILQTLQKIRNALRTQSISAQDRLEDFDMSAFVRDLYDEGSVPLFHGHEISELKSMHDNAVYRVTKACNELREKAIQSLLRDYLDVLYKVERRHRTSIGGPMTLPPPVPTSPYGSVPYPYGHPSSSPHALPSSYVPPPAPSVRAEFAPAPPSESTFDPRMTQSTTYPSFDPSSSRTDVVPSYDAPSSSFDPSSYDALPPSGQRMVDPPRPGSRAPRPDPTASANTDRMPVPSSNVKGSSYVPPSPPSLPMVQWSSQYTNLEPYVSNLPYTVTEPQANALSQVVQDSESRGRTPDQTLAVLDHTARNMNLTPIESATPPVPVNAPSTMNLAPPSTGTRMVDPPTITSAPPVEPSLPVVQWSSQYTNLEPYVSKLPYTVTEPQANALSQVVQDSESRGRTPDQTLAVLDHTAQTMNLTPIESDTVNNNGYETALNDYESNTNGGYETAPNDYESNAAPTVSNGPNGSSKDQRNAAKREPTYAVKDVVDEYDELQPYVGVLPETLTETNAIELARAVQDANARGLSPEKTQALVETEIEALGLNRPTNNASDLEPVVDPVLPGLPTSDGNGSNDNGPFENAPPSPNGDDSFFDSNDPYVVLGVSKDATASELRRAYRSAQLRAHPNKGGSNPAFRKVQNAYKRLEPLHRRKDPVRSRNANVATDSSSNESSKDQRNAAEREPTYAVEDVVDEYDELQPYVGVLPETLTETNAIELASAVQDANARGLSPEKTQALVETEIEALGLNRPTNNASDLEPVVDPVLPGLPTSDGNGSNDNGPFENAPPSPNGDDSFFDSNDPYVVLGVSKDATASELRRAYRSAQLRAHPNKGGSNPAFRKVQNAYKRLEPLHMRKDPVRSRNANVATDSSSNESSKDQRNAAEREPTYAVEDVVDEYDELQPYVGVLPETLTETNAIELASAVQDANARGLSPEKTQALVETEIEALGLNRPTNNASDLEPVVDPVLPGLPTSDGNGSNDNGPFENAPPSPNGDDSFFDSNDPYVVLGVSKDATASELRRAYRSAQLRAHPNKGGSNPAFRKVQNAYKRLEPLHRRKDPVRSRNANVATDPSSNGSTNAMSVSTFVRRYPETRPYANELPPTISDPMGVSIRREIQQGNQRGSSVPQIRNRVRNVVLYNARRNIVPVPEHDDREDRIEENDANLNDLGFRTPDGNVESLDDSSNVAYNNTNDETYETASEDEYLDATNQGNNNVRNVIPFQNRGVGRVSNGGNRAPNEEYAMEPNEVEFRTPDGNVESLNVLENEPNADGSNLGELENERFDENEVAGQGFTETDLNAWQSNETDATNGSMQSNQTRLNLENPFTGEMNPPLEGEVPEETRESTPNEREFVLRSHPLHGLPEYEDDEENENEFRLRSHPLPDLSSEEENDPEPTLQSHPLEGLSEEGENEDPFERDGADMDGVGDNNEGLFRPTNAANFDLTGGDDGFGSNGQNEVAENAFDTWNEQDEPDDEEENNRAAENGGNGGWVDDGTQSRPTPLPPPMKNAGVQTKRVPNVPMKTSGMQTNNSRNRNGKKRPTNRPASDNASKENAPNKPATTNPAQETNLSLPPPPNTGNLISGSNTNRTNASNGSLARFNTLARASNSNDGSDTTNVSFFNPLAYNRWKKNNNGTYTVPNAGGKNNETDPYAVLETTADATDDAIRSAYKVMALKKHPNKGGSAEAFRAVKNAYNRIRLARGMS